MMMKKARFSETARVQGLQSKWLFVSSSGSLDLLRESHGDGDCDDGYTVAALGRERDEKMSRGRRGEDEAKKKTKGAREGKVGSTPKEEIWTTASQKGGVRRPS